MASGSTRRGHRGERNPTRQSPQISHQLNRLHRQRARIIPAVVPDDCRDSREGKNAQSVRTSHQRRTGQEKKQIKVGSLFAPSFSRLSSTSPASGIQLRGGWQRVGATGNVVSSAAGIEMCCRSEWRSARSGLKAAKPQRSTLV